MKRLHVTIVFIAAIAATSALQSCQPTESIAPSTAKIPVVLADSGAVTGESAPWSLVSFSDDGSTYSGFIAAPDLTDSLLNDSYVHVYMRDGDKIVQLPYTQYVNGQTESIVAVVEPGHIEIVSSRKLVSRQFRYTVVNYSTPGKYIR